MAPLLVLAAAATLAGCGAEAPGPVARARPVETTTLHASAPERIVEVTGVARPWREAKVGFQVSGPVELVRDVGSQVRGPEVDDDGKVVPGGQGDVIAWIDPDRYALQLESVQRALDAARKGLEVLRVDAQEVAPEQIARAQAQRDATAARVSAVEASLVSATSNLETQQTELRRMQQLFRSKTVAQADVDRQKNVVAAAQGEHDSASAEIDAVRGDLQSAEAALREARAGLRLKERQVERTEAEVAELEVKERQAKTDLDDCQLHAPFGGRITAVHVNRGDFVRAGTHVVTLTLIDPIKISATVSAEDERRIQPGTRGELVAAALDVEPPNEESLWAAVKEKGDVADAATRTYVIDMILRNWRRREYLAHDPEAKVITRNQILPLIERYAGEGHGLYAHPSAIFQKDGKTVLLRLPEIRGYAMSDPDGLYRKMQPDVVEIVPGEESIALLGFPFRRIEAAHPEKADLRPGDMVIGQVDIATYQRSEGPPEQYLDHGVVVEHTEWALRPGQLVPIRFHTGRRPEGYYVPVQAILDRDGTRTVFAVEDGQARALPVTVTDDTYRESRRIEGEGLHDGLELVTKGAQYLGDGVAVEVTSR